MKRTRRTIEIGIGTIFWVFFALVSLKFLGNILDIFILVFISILIALALCPLVDALEMNIIFHLNLKRTTMIMRLKWKAHASLSILKARRC